MWGITQSELAQRSGLDPATIFRAERGDPVRSGSILRICKGLGTNLEGILRRDLTVLSSHAPQVVHRSEATYWRAPVDRRKRIPSDSAERVTDPAERLRLGRLGLVPVFAGYLDLVMPEGPGATLIELYGRYAAPFNHAVYRDAILYCQRGEVRLAIGNNVYELAAGDFVGYLNEELRWMEPIGLLPAQEPVLLLWTGAVRIGAVLKPDQRRTAVRKPRKPG